MPSFLDKLFGLDDKVSLLTGAGGHIVSTLAEGLSRSGCKVIVADLRLNKAEAVAQKINAFGGHAVAAALDVTNKKAWEECISDIVTKHGRLDILLNGAGINAPTPLLEIATQEWNDIFATNLTGTLIGCQVAGKQMLEQRSGSIINISSASAGPPLSKAFAYSASKAAVANLTQNIAREFAPSGVRVNSLRPGFFPTEWNLKNFINEQRKHAILSHTPMGRFGEPFELLGAVLWLASNASGFVTGAEICVDGGFLAMTI